MDEGLGLERALDGVDAVAFELDGDHAGVVGLVDELQHPVIIGARLVAFVIKLKCLGANGGGVWEAFGDAVVAIEPAEVVEVRQQAGVGAVDFL